MIEKQYQLDLDIKMKSFHSFAFFTNGDVGVNTLHLSILDDQEPVDLSSVSDITINFKRPDGTYVLGKMLEIVDAKNGKLMYHLGTSETEQLGRVYASIVFYGENGERLTSSAFFFNVVESLASDEAFESTEEFTILTKMMNEVNQLIDEVSQMKPPQFHFGNDIPENTLGEDFDYYLDMRDKVLYEKKGGQWTFLTVFIGDATVTNDGFMTKEHALKIFENAKRIGELESQGVSHGEIIEREKERITFTQEDLKRAEEMFNSGLDFLNTTIGKTNLDLSSLQTNVQNNQNQTSENIGLVQADIDRLVSELEENQLLLLQKSRDINNLDSELLATKTRVTSVEEDIVEIREDMRVADIDVDVIRTDVENLKNKTETVIENRVTNPINPKIGQIWILI